MAYLYRDVNQTATNHDKCTISIWFKKTVNGVEETLISGHESDTNRFKIRFRNDDKLDAELGNGGNWYSLITNRLFRDTNAWYHLVMAYDTSQSTASERAKMYINGVQETSFATADYPPQNNDVWLVKNSCKTAIGRFYYNGSYQGTFTGLMSHVHVVDGTMYAASAFGSTDATTGIWKINTSPSITMGNNGFTVLKDGNTYTDQSANSNNFTLSGTLTKTEDCPSNVFATWNALANTGLTLQNGNTYTVYASNDHNCKTTLGMNSGKYYWEMKPNGVSGTVTGICRDTTKQQADISNTSGEHVYAMQYNSGNVSYKTNGTFTSSSSWGTYVSGDIVQFAYDADNGKLFIGKNGTYKDFSGNTGDPVNGTYPTFSSLDTTATWFPFVEHRGGSENNYWNFGNGYFGTTAVSSAGTNANGIGIFEYDVPTGYTALSTKGLNL